MMNAALFSAYGTSKRLLGETPKTPLTIQQYWIAGLMAGFVVAFVEVHIISIYKICFPIVWIEKLFTKSELK